MVSLGRVMHRDDVRRADVGQLRRLPERGAPPRRPRPDQNRSDGSSPGHSLGYRPPPCVGADRTPLAEPRSPGRRGNLRWLRYRPLMRVRRRGTPRGDEMTIQRSRSAGRPTLDEVAARAGVGRGTVSRVVNGSPQVSPEAKAAVQQAIDELGYVPNRAARALVTQRTDSVALFVSESEERVFGEPFFAGIIRGINSMLLETPMHLWLAMAQSKTERERVEHHLTTQHVDGVLLMSLHGEDRLPTLLAQRGLPVVVCGQPGGKVKIRGDQMTCADAANVGAAKAGLLHLINQGREQVAAIAGPQDMEVGISRLAGYRKAMVDA